MGERQRGTISDSGCSSKSSRKIRMNTRISATSIKKKYKSLIASLKQDLVPHKEPTKVTMQQIRRKLKRLITTKKTFLTRKITTSTEVFSKFMPGNMRKHYKISSRVQALCMPTKCFMRKISSQTMNKKLSSHKTTPVRLAVRQTFLM